MLVLGEAIVHGWGLTEENARLVNLVKKEGELLVGARNLYKVYNAGDKNVLLN